MKNKILIISLVMLLMVNLVFGASQELNFSRESEETTVGSSTAQANLRIASIRQDPFPANPGEYVDVYFKIENNGGDIKSPQFELVMPYPLSVYPEENKVKIFPSIASREKITLNYRIKIDENAVPGTYEGEFRAKVNGEDAYYPYYFNIKVDDVTTTFDVALQEITKEGASIAISNTGKNTANSITVRLDNQESFDLFGPSSYIIGNLNNGDYTILNVLVAPKEGEKNPKLKLQIDYTDIIGNRRTVEKEIPVQLNAQIERGFSELVQGVMNSNTGEQQSNSAFKYLTVFLIIALIVMFIYHKKKIKKHRNKEE